MVGEDGHPLISLQPPPPPHPFNLNKKYEVKMRRACLSYTNHCIYLGRSGVPGDDLEYNSKSSIGIWY